MSTDIMSRLAAFRCQTTTDEDNAFITEVMAEMHRLRADRELLLAILEGLEDITEDPQDGTRGWNGNYQSYHRGCTLFRGSLTPDEGRKLFIRWVEGESQQKE